MTVFLTIMLHVISPGHIYLKLVAFFFFLDFIYLFMRDTEREAETQAEGEAGSPWGAQCGT